MKTFLIVKIRKYDGAFQRKEVREIVIHELVWQ